MKNPLVRRGAVGIAAGALALTGLANLAAPAHATIQHGEVTAEVDLANSGTDCHVTPWDGPSAVALLDNGAPVSQSWSATATGTHANPADVTTLSASSRVTASMTPIGAGPSTIKVDVTAAASTAPALADSACSGRAEATPRMQAELDLPVPMWVTITGNGDGNGAAQAAIGDFDGTVAALVLGSRGAGSTSILLPAGLTAVQVQGQARAEADDAVKSRSYAASFTFELQPLGAASGISGSSKGTVVLGARDCASGGIAVDLTKKAKKKAKQVRVSVNGAKVAKLKGKKLKPRTLVVPAARGAAVEVAVQVKLKNGKKATVKRSYQACS